MRILLDSATLLFWAMGGERLTTRARDAVIAADAVFVSTVTAMELSTKFRIGKLDQAALLVREYEQRLADEGFMHLPLTQAHALLAGSIVSEFRDPFDRMLAAQARIETLAIVSPDAAFDGLGARRLW